jgi:hypothetical protein
VKLYTIETEQEDDGRWLADVEIILAQSEDGYPGRTICGCAYGDTEIGAIVNAVTLLMESEDEG